MGKRLSVAVLALLRARLLAVAAVVAAVSAIIPPFAGAAVPAFANDCANDLDPGSCERLTYIATQQDSISQAATYAWWGIWTACGILLVLLIAQPFVDSFRFWK